ncbi:LpqB family beta-propeller domain-containing protein [Ornithinimicrobium sufpigmenti]|uniref:LpqB family beta-propeller domain-containing protein n=1 Tax=Ornithinimicrobium sufpigmenti TaxID=2508882 RepID=UPI001036DDCB|nr:MULTISPECIES: LpqB family beta-propeller domain-containing protein [unclassified Ornithinimicrobium]
MSFRHQGRHRARPEPRRPRGLGGTAVVALLLSACSGQLPTTPEPRAGLPVQVQAQPEIERLLNPPQPDASAADIVRGFLRANVGFADEDDVARLFLLEGLASEWVPTSNVLVYDGTPVVTVSDDGREAEVSIEVVARIDGQGRLTEQAAATVTESFELTRVQGQWRIRAFPEDFGVWLTYPDLVAAFRASTLYHLSTHGQHFVPEVRWLARGEGLPTAVTRAALAPAPEHLAGAVRSGANENVRLAAPSVTVDPETRVATVPLEGSGLIDGSDSAEALVSQISHALLELGGISAVDVQVAGRSLTVGGSEGPVTSTGELPYSDAMRDVDIAMLRIGEQFFPVNPTAYNLRNLPEETARNLELPRLGLSWGGVAATEDLQDFAAVSTDRASLWRWQAGDGDEPGESSTNAGIADELTPPAVDPQGAFLVAGVHRSTGAPRLWWLERDDVQSLAEPLDAPWLRDRDRVRSLSISPDGTRVAMVLGDTSRERGRLMVAGILRDQDGEPKGLTQAVPAAGALVDVSSARWASSRELYLVGQRQDDAAPRGFSLPLGDFLQPLGAVDGIDFVEVIPVPRIEGPRPIVHSADGRFYTTEGTQGWFNARNGDELVIPGS